MVLIFREKLNIGNFLRISEKKVISHVTAMFLFSQKKKKKKKKKKNAVQFTFLFSGSEYLNCFDLFYS